jgi:CRISPR/Cas system-associated protein Csm6
MRAVFGTLGWRPESLLPTVRSAVDVRKLVFYHSDHARSRAARDHVVAFCEEIGLSVQATELSDAFDLLDIARRIRKDLKRVRTDGYDIVRFNIAGGTRLMSSAALLVCILEGIPTSYVHDESYREIRLPLLRIEYGDALSRKQKEILRHLIARRNAPVREVDLARELALHRATVNHHLRQLVNKGVVLIDPDPADARARLVRVAPGVDLLLDL